MIIDKQSTHLNKLRAALSYLTTPIHYMVDLPSTITYKLDDYFTNNNRLRAEIQLLREEQRAQKIQLLKLAALDKENIRLRALLEKSFKLGEQVLVAELLSVNLEPFKHIVVVNKGSGFGVHTKQAVIDANGIVGQVYRALPFSSEIILITDPNHAIPVQINRNGLRTIAIGSGQPNRINLPFLPNNADVLPGDLLVSSGLGETFPQGYPVAVVDKFIPKPNEPFAEVYATPKAELNKTRELLIVWNNTTSIPLSQPETEISDQDHAEQ